MNVIDSNNLERDYREKPGSTFSHPALFLIAFALIVLDLRPAVAQQGSRALRRGEALVTRHCGKCHNVTRTGASRNPQAPPFRMLSQRYAIDSLEEALGEGLTVGHPDMPEFRFDPDDVGAIITYLKSLQPR